MNSWTCGDVTGAPQISVLISSYNCARFVARKLREIRRQTFFANSEFLFIETGSPEHERELFAPFCAEYPNCRLITTDNRRGLYEAWNLGWHEARAPLVCNSNMDDAMHPRLLELVAGSMQAKQWDACSVLIAKQLDTDPQLDDWSPPRLKRLPIGRRPGPFTAWRNDLRESVGMFDEAFVGAGDLDFWSRLVAQGKNVGLVPKVLYLYTKGAAQLSKTNDDRHARDQARLASKPYPIGWHKGWQRRVLWLRYLVPLFPGLFCVPASAGEMPTS